MKTGFFPPPARALRRWLLSAHRCETPSFSHHCNRYIRRMFEQSCLGEPIQRRKYPFCFPHIAERGELPLRSESKSAHFHCRYIHWFLPPELPCLAPLRTNAAVLRKNSPPPSLPRPP